jgi:hypothetical protein
MSQSGQVVLVVAEAGAADFIAPLLGEWLNGRAPPFQWHIVAAPVAAKRLSATVPASASKTTVAPDSNADISPLLEGARALVASAGRFRMIETHALRAAKRLRLPSLQFVDAWNRVLCRFGRDGKFEIADRVLMIDDTAIENAVAHGLPRECFVAVGHPGFERAAMLPETDDDAVLYLGSPIRETLRDTLGYDQYDCLEIVAAAAAKRPDLLPKILYAAHPEEAKAPGGIEHVETGVGLLRCATVIGCYAAPMIGAYLGGRRVVSVQPSLAGGNIFEPSRRGLVRCVSDADGLIAALEEKTNPSEDFRDLFRASTARVAAEIESFVAKTF